MSRVTPRMLRYWPAKDCTPSSSTALERRAACTWLSLPKASSQPSNRAFSTSSGRGASRIRFCTVRAASCRLWGTSASTLHRVLWIFLNRPLGRSSARLLAWMVTAKPGGTGMSSMLLSSPRLAFLPPTL